MKESLLAKILAGIILAFLTLGIGLAEGDSKGRTGLSQMDSSKMDFCSIEEEGFSYYSERSKIILECSKNKCV
ncbi:MAG: hypothetical protein JJ971_05155 [Balneolaceae bacterium]|nr:hypothetical protein [Balneolaceae bacterium]MBO6545765.1 hypothetical protein [Balneolaceae bacterium]MBO6647161.1 hypothetical protein [Balneolaceae bacterium]